MKSNSRLVFFYKSKRSFLLIEIIIALAIISLLITPLIRNPVYFFKSQIRSLEKLECERIANLSFLDLKLEIYKNKNKFIKDLASSKNAAEYQKFEDFVPYRLTTFNNKLVERSFKLYSRRKEKKSKENEKYRLLNIRIFLRPIDQKMKYEYEYKMLCKIS